MATVDRRLEDLLENAREDLNVELKPWVDLSSNDDRANIAQALIALANHGGGYLLLGFEDQGGRGVPLAADARGVETYAQDSLNGIVARYADPAFHCTVELVRHRIAGTVHPVVVVPPGRVPIRVKRDGPDNKHLRQNTYPIRRPGPCSEPPQTSQEWDALIRRCVRAAREDLVDAIRDLVIGVSKSAPTVEPDPMADLNAWHDSGRARLDRLVTEDLPDERPSRYAHGVWAVSYCLAGAGIQQRSLAEFRQVLARTEGHETGWPVWHIFENRDELRPYPHDGLIECWLRDVSGRDPAHSDFWRADPAGKMFLLRGYQEDGDIPGVSPGSVLDVTLPVWRVGECVLHAARFAAAFDAQLADVLLRVTWDGLKGRRLESVTERRWPLMNAAVCRVSAVTARVSTSARMLANNPVAVVAQLTAAFYEAFDFFKLPPGILEQEFDRMRKKA